MISINRWPFDSPIDENEALKDETKALRAQIADLLIENDRHRKSEAALVGYLESVDRAIAHLETSKDAEIKTLAAKALEAATFEKSRIAALEITLETERNSTWRLVSDLSKANMELERLHVQLAGCLTAAEGATKNPACTGDYGWSPAYQAVLDLRYDFEVSQAQTVERVEKIDLTRTALKKYREWFKNDLAEALRKCINIKGFSLRVNDIEDTLQSLNS
jgi:hypothetical protein